MKKFSLNGTWGLYYFKQDSLDIRNPNELKEANISKIEAKVPGNVELDLSREGVLPEDLFKGENIRALKEYEDYEWWYETEFETPSEAKNQKCSLYFGGVDCLAEYWLNGDKIGSSSNMFIPVELDVTGKLRDKDKNHLVIRIRSALREAYNTDYSSYPIMNTWETRIVSYESLYVRKAPHSYGWDIMPRAVTSGLWRDVDLIVKSEYELKQLFCFFTDVTEKKAVASVAFELDAYNSDNMEIEVTGVCGESVFTSRGEIGFKVWKHKFEIQKPKLWWPYGYGEPNLYDTTIRIFKDGKEVICESIKLGIRSVRLERTDVTDGINGNFEFFINDVPVICKGTNWVPLDAFHSRDKERYEKALELVKDIGCNILRCWGGNVYEDKDFFDFCDENGIMVWQDFSMACHAYPQDEDFQKQMKQEAETIIKLYRNHPSIILWSGDNECDIVIYFKYGCPTDNIITRKILQRAVIDNDKGRPYLASSPYISDELSEKRIWNIISEDHLWGPRDYFKSSYYTTSNCHFISEIGYHGCPSLKSIEKFIDKEYIWPIHDNPQWNIHSTDMHGSDYRVVLMENQVKQLFGVVPENIEDFIFASQISQAEAKKFFIENVRVNREFKKGIIWWNLLDGWPQMSDAVVDYYFDKKIAYDYIKRSQQPFAIMCGELDDWHIPVVASNDTLDMKSGRYTVKDVGSDKVLLEGIFTVKANNNEILGKIPVMYSEKGMFLIEWEIDGKHYSNHYLYGMPGFELETYKKWYEKIK